MAARADAAGAPHLTSAPGAEVVVDSVGKTFRRGGRRTVALAWTSLQVRPGELACLLGPSGCGKSTLLRIIAGALAADEGTVTVGRPVTGPSPDRGMLFQTPMLFGWLTTRNNILFGPRAQRAARLHERDDPELDEEATALLERVGLGGFGDAFPHELSGGMRHRAAFARALASRPSVLLMDEPFGALELITRERMHEFLLDIWEQHRITIIFVTHDIEEAILLGDRVAAMGGLLRHQRDHRHPAGPAAACPRHRHRGVPGCQAADPRLAEELTTCPCGAPSHPTSRSSPSLRAR